MKNSYTFVGKMTYEQIEEFTKTLTEFIGIQRNSSGKDFHSRREYDIHTFPIGFLNVKVGDRLDANPDERFSAMKRIISGGSEFVKFVFIDYGSNDSKITNYIKEVSVGERKPKRTRGRYDAEVVDEGYR